MGAVGDKKVPFPLRILAALLLLAIYGGLVGVLIFIGINEKNWIVLIFGVIIALAIYQLMVDIYKFPKFLHPGLLMALARCLYLI